MQRISVLGVPVDLYTCPEFIEFLANAARLNTKTVVAYANIHEVNLAHTIPGHRAYLNSAAAVILDGFGVWLGARLLGYPVSRMHRLTGPDFLDPLIREFEARKISIYLLGGEPYVLASALARMSEVAPSLVAYGHHGFFQKSGPENDAVIKDINAKAPDILYLGFGSPAQEKWISDNMDRVNARVFFPSGAALDYYTGSKRRGPRWLTDRGAEWICRLLSEPRRLWRRYLVGNPVFFFRIACCVLGRAIQRLTT